MFSSTRSCRTQLTAHCCGAVANAYMPTSAALEEKFADQVEEAAPAAIARHYTEAGLADPAARYWLAASELALSRSAYAEADRYVAAGLALIPRLPLGTDRESLELALHVTCVALSPLKAYTAPEDSRRL